MNINLVYRNKKPGDKPIFPEDIVRKAVADYFEENPILIPDTTIAERVIEHLVANPELIINYGSMRDAIGEVVAQYFEETGFGDYLQEIDIALGDLLDRIPTHTSQLENDSGFVTKSYVDNAITNNFPVIPDSDDSELDGATISERLTEFLAENGIELNDIPTAMNVITEHEATIYELTQNTQGYGLIQSINDAIALEDESVANIVPILKNVQGNLDDIVDIKNTLGDINTALATLVDVGGAE